MAQSSPIPNTTPECLPSAADRILWISANSPARLFIVRASINPGLPPLPFEAKKTAQYPFASAGRSRDFNNFRNPLTGFDCFPRR
jgi:hypothetical protein